MQPTSAHDGAPDDAKRASRIAHVDVLIVGAGISGIDLAYRLQRRNPKLRYAILEARERLGGTWDLFRYPGIRSDSDIATLGFPFYPYRGEKAIVDGASIRAYIAQTAAKFGIDRHIRYGHRVVAADWSSSDCRWTVTCSVAGATVTATCDFLLACAGYYDYARGHAPEWPGLETYAGEFVHPQRWPENLEVSGKRVVVIGSGATAVTLVPALAAQGAAHVTMLQRSPSYIASLPSRDSIAQLLHKRFPRRIADALVRWKNIAYSAFTYRLARTQPARFKKLLFGGVRQAMGSDYVPASHDEHFTPSYEPWDQRLCLVPDSDLFVALRSGRAEIVTGRIAEFTSDRIRLESGDTLAADVVVSATGLTMQFFGGVAMRVDDSPIDIATRMVYKGTMLEGVPNFAFAFGYTHSSWTLKVDLGARYIANVVRFMKRRSYASATPLPSSDSIVREPLLGLSSGYVRRAEHLLPRRGPRPWRTHDNYLLDLLALRTGKIDDGTLRFAKKPKRAPSTMAEYRGKLVLITGGAAGIGKSIALSFAKRGANIVLTDIDAAALANARAEIEAFGVRCHGYVADVSNQTSMRELADSVETEAGVPDVLVNNAGIGFLGAILKSSLDHWNRIFGVNVIGVVNGCYYFLPKMLAAGGKRHVVVIASGAASYPPPNAAAYGASKAAVFSFAESLKMELRGTNVSVTTVCPGITNTSIVQRKPDDGGAAVSPEQRERMLRYYERNGATPEQVAQAVYRGVERNEDVVFVGPASRLMYNVRRLSLPLARKLTFEGAKRAGFR